MNNGIKLLANSQGAFITPATDFGFPAVILNDAPYLICYNLEKISSCCSLILQNRLLSIGCHVYNIS